MNRPTMRRSRRSSRGFGARRSACLSFLSSMSNAATAQAYARHP